MQEKEILYSKVPFRILLLFNIKNIFNELVFVILNFMLLISSIIFGIITLFMKEQEKVVLAFNFYILFYISCFLFILILRMVQFFYHNKMEDKTTFISISNQVSRTNFFISQWSIIYITVLLNTLMTFILINIINIVFSGFIINPVLLRITLVFLIYTLVSGFLILNFIIFLIFIFSLQTTTIICTLILSLTFIANLPTNFQKTNEKSMTIKFNNNQLLTVPDLYEAFDFQHYVSQNKIKYNFLSKYTNDFFIKNEYQFNEFNTNENIIKQRVEELWNDLGIIKREPLVIERDNLFINNLPSNDSNIPIDWAINDELSLKLTLENTFISIDELKILVDSEQNKEKQLILEDLYNFSIYINNEFKDLQKEKVDLFETFIFMENSIDKNSITNKSKNNLTNFKKDYLLSMYNYQLAGTFKEAFTLKNDENTYSLIRNDLNFDLMLCTRILEQYFIKYTDRYIESTTYSVNKTAADWNKYYSTRKKLNLFSYINIFNGMWSNYTLHSGFSYSDFWFLPYSESKITFDNQKSSFLGYVEYTFKLNDKNIIEKDTYNNYFNPLYFIIVLSLLSIFNISFAIIKFKKIDIK
ncbi:ABC transporter permease [Spiroplasma endosymbiont of Cantharis nigra]|uniref:ABC transporter permease n=1 Tax=Spiroplasma endosymbiont of Cantharis nigra TaxID=3066278 RepID=UPI0030D181F4